VRQTARVAARLIVRMDSGNSRCFLALQPRERNDRSTNGPHPIPFAKKEQSDVERDD
jgi:hypothetical protein